MTAEICIMNKTGIALAADSAVTIDGGRKILNSANKVFELSKFHPVGIMINGNAEFHGIPWETIIKVYRKKICNIEFSTLEEYADDFIAFLGSDSYFEFNEKAYERKAIENLIFNILLQLKGRFQQSIYSAPEGHDFQKSEAFFNSIKKTIIEEKFIDGFDNDDIALVSKEYKSFFEKNILRVFELSTTAEDQQLLETIKDITIQELLKHFGALHSEVVISGYGKNDLFPALKSFKIDINIANKRKIAENKHNRITLLKTASIVPFAQTDMIHTFMLGINPEIKNFIDHQLVYLFNSLSDIIGNSLEGVLPEQQLRPFQNILGESIRNILSENQQEIDNYLRKCFSDPILNNVETLPKNQLAELAESLINLTSFKRKVSNDLETVGGPIDVAIITKGDGFIWIKRKHYFELDKNPSFNHNNFGGYSNEQDDERD